MVRIPQVRVASRDKLRLEAFCRSTDRSVASAVRYAIRRLLDDFEAQA